MYLIRWSRVCLLSDWMFLVYTFKYGGRKMQIKVE